MDILYVLLVLLLVTRVFGEIAVRLGQPALLGELLAGIARGATATLYSDALPVGSRVRRTLLPRGAQRE